MIEQREQQSVAEIFASSGEPAFAAWKASALRAMLQDEGARQRSNISAGRRSLCAGAKSEALDVQPAQSRSYWKLRWKNCGGVARVSAKSVRWRSRKHRFNELFAARRADYAAGPIRVQTLGKSVQQVTAEIERLLQSADENKQVEHKAAFGGRKVKAVKFAILLSAVLATSIVSLTRLTRPKTKERRNSKVADSGSFGIFMNGKRVGTETFSITETPNAERAS